jgi:hypothetical protein
MSIQNQQTSLLDFISLNGTALTNHNRRYSLSESVLSSDSEVISGKLRRFYRPNKKILTISFSYLPNKKTHTVDGKYARDFIVGLVETSPFVSVYILDNPRNEPVEFTGFINNYRESIIRRDFIGQCIYYNVDFEIEES